ncbi:MAG: c-type cytochrome [Acidobacteria bacterium]|nr:c-type cytochrome [Acidobacteriota bacterium]
MFSYRSPWLMLCLSCVLPACTPEPTALAGRIDSSSEHIVEIGKRLFFDKRLSVRGDMSCETCHIPELGWGDGRPLSRKFDGTLNMRHTPTLMNVGQYRDWYWDGRAATLEKQIIDVWKTQMGANPEKISTVLSNDRDYNRKFVKYLGGPPTSARIVTALSAFLATIESKEAPWDRYESGDRGAVTEEAKAGFEVFAHKANCTLCHLPPLYTDTLHHNVGIGYDTPDPDQGRGGYLLEVLYGRGAFEENFNARNLTGAFKTPTLRSITETAPYFHDGRAATLEEAVNLMLAGGIPNRYLDARITPKRITPDQRRQLLAFLRSLTPTSIPFARP